jgi:hypothetical protein
VLSMNWPYWLALFVLDALPISLLLADRILGLPASPLIRRILVPWLGLVAALVVYGLFVGEAAAWLFLVGAVGGLAGTVTLDAVRLSGLRAGAFPMDMPMMFGVIALGLAPRFQRHVMIRLVTHMADLPPEERRAMLSERIRAIARLDEDDRPAVMATMRAGLERLSSERRAALVGLQMEIMARDLSSSERQAIMAAMDAAAAAIPSAPYRPPRGLPRIPMTLFRTLALPALASTVAELPGGQWKVTLAGYTWHALNGLSFGVMYTMLVGAGSWGWALVWGLFVWAAMMVAMPLMMPMIRFPWWFPVVPLAAHVAMVVPLGAIALAAVSPHQSEASLLAQVSRLLARTP